MNNRYNKYLIISGTSALIIIFAFLIVEIYTRTLDDSKKDYQQQQLEMTRIAGHGINLFIDHLINDIKFISGSVQNNNNPVSYIYLKNYLSNTENNPVQSIFRSDGNGNIVYSIGKPLPYWTSDYIKEQASSNKKDETFISMVDRYENDIKNYNLVFHLINVVPQKNNEKTGYIGFVINFNILINEYIRPLKLNKADFAWVMDGEGRLIYHPNHQEMLLHSIKKTSEECFQCHTDFIKQKKMLSSNFPNTDEYKVINGESPKIMAYYPLVINNQKWILAISTVLTKVTENLRERFKVFFIIGVVILIVILFFSFAIYFINGKRIRAEESRRNLEKIHIYRDQLNQSAKLASIGVLVDSVAHEINTPAGIISAHLDGLSLQNKIPNEMIPEFNIIKKQIRRITDYTRTLLNYSHRMEFKPEFVNLKDLMEECLYILGPKFRQNKIKIEKNLNNAPVIKADPGQLQQVIINILLNSSDAILNGGVIKITLEKIIKDKTDWGVIIIEDNGTGISDENIDKIFNAFFSTKQKDKGTGLGLYISKAIIQRHKGNISVKSSGNGSIFEVYLPVNGTEEL